MSLTLENSLSMNSENESRDVSREEAFANKGKSIISRELPYANFLKIRVSLNFHLRNFKF